MSIRVLWAMTLPNPLRIIARADTVTMIFAWNHLFRLITLTDAMVISDPKVLAKPWERTFVYRKQAAGDINDNDSCLDRISAGQAAVPPGY